MNKHGRSDLALLTVLVAIAEARTVSGAAARLGMSQPAVSHALKRLRDLVNDPLFVRAGNELVMTKVCEAMLPASREIVVSARALLDPSEFEPATSRFRWRIAVSDYALTALGGALSDRVQAVNSLLSIDFLPFGTTTTADLLERRIDFAIIGDSFAPRIAPPLFATELFRETYIGVMCAKHPLAGVAREAKMTAEAWLSFPHVTFSAQSSGVSSIDRVLASLGFSRNIARISPSHQWNVRAIIGTEYLLALPVRLLNLVSPEKHVMFQFPIDVPSYPYFLLENASHTKTGAVKYMRDLILDVNRAAFAGGSMSKVEHHEQDNEQVFPGSA